MHLKRLELKGFKSFPTKTEINFNEGITAIVGPNGSGKSNISDAVRWVLGEQSIKSLRGDKLEDVIFAGTVDKKPMNYCEVALTIDNSDEKLNIDFSEVTIKRRAYRNGESGFFLNDKACRLKDIKELLLDTGIGKDGYSIIEQGKVDEILSNNPANRRKVFDEACGISKYRYKKLEAEKNLKNTKENLERIEDVYIEIENRIKPLFNQQKKALKYLELRENLKKLEVNNYIREIKKIDQELSEITKQKTILAKELNEKEALREKMDKNVELANEEIEKLEQNISKLSEYIDSIKNVINQNDSQISLINERINNSKANIENNKKTLDDFELTLKEDNEKLIQLQNKRKVDEEAISILEKEIYEIEQKNSQKEQKLNELTKNLENLKDNIITYLNEKRDLSNSLSMLGANVENINSRNEAIQNNICDISTSLHEKESIYKEKEDKINEMKDNLKNKTLDLNNLKTNLEDYKVKNKDIEIKIQNNNYSQKEYSSKLQIYRDMEKHYEGFNRGVKEVLKNKNLSGICGALGQVITTKEKYEKAIEAALGAYMQNIITTDQFAAKNAISYLKKNNMGRVTFLPMNVIKSKRINETTINAKTAYIKVASDLVSFDEQYRDIIENILGRTIVIDNIDNGIKFANETNHRFKVVTLDGDILNPGGSLTGGSLKSTTNILSRKRLISDFEEKIKNIKIENEEYLKNKQIITDSILETRKEIEKYEIDINLIEKDIVKQNTKLKSIEYEIDSLNQNIEKLQKEKIGLNSNLEYTSNKIENIEQNIKQIELKELENKKQIEELSKIQETQNNDFDKDKKQIENLKLDFVQKSEIFKSTDSEINRIKDEINNTNKKIIENKNSIENLQKDIENLNNEAQIQKRESENLNTELSKKNKEMDNAQQAKNKFKENINDLNKQLKAFERQSMELRQSEFKIETKIERLSANKESYTTRLFEDYDLSYVKALEFRDDSIEINKKILESIKREISSLGNINIDSINEYKETKERYDFYSEQKIDLEESINAIEKIIDELEVNMKVQFKEEFTKVNENFKYVYKRLFGGGEGELTILDEDNILESDIQITAKPPGKKMKNLNLLSGGEKALTAISILFAIILAKPTPFCILDEIEAPLDDANIFRFGEYLKELSEDTQFIAVTHRRGTMEAADYIYGVTMEQKAISKVISLDLHEAHKMTDIV
ncbi:chromosome segregation protein SMC [Intestinibacter bartlettii]|uniref:Chromosome partition protein Smc n=1 Tax=Intestinibacter bartlettii TaxID=261299 RepID=A0ABS6DT26_9FIRM|nr:chromosome segregation protein SMC [Intestinibacter bartlettii]